MIIMKYAVMLSLALALAACSQSRPPLLTEGVEISDLDVVDILGALNTDEFDAIADALLRILVDYGDITEAEFEYASWLMTLDASFAAALESLVLGLEELGGVLISHPFGSFAIERPDGHINPNFEPSVDERNMGQFIQAFEDAGYLIYVLEISDYWENSEHIVDGALVIFVLDGFFMPASIYQMRDEVALRAAFATYGFNEQTPVNGLFLLEGFPGNWVAVFESVKGGY